MKIWITTVGKSVYAVVNTLWAACKEEGYIPERIYFIYNDEVKENLGRVKKIAKALVESYGAENPEINEIKAEETNFTEFAKKLGEIIKREKALGNEVAVDMTPGRKFMSAFAMYSGVSKEVRHRTDRIYYLHLSDFDFRYVDKAYPKIPFNKQKLYEMKRSLGILNDF